ncbi:MAG: glycoside hydrolase family 99-like domain-containing protein [Armatimonadetes bacterium]|nr:glycoside hydrolase family 99-like domain-containing protein [Armatimonadota bacterium]
MVRCLSILACLLAVVAPASAATTRAPVRVGCYYFPGWYTADRWAPILEYGGREPVLGWYRDDLPAVQDWHIRQARQHGVSFWVFDWYYDHRTGTVLEHNVALDKGFLNASLNRTMDFAVMWCNEEPGEPDYTEEQMLRLARTLGERYFRRPNHLRVGGRNVLVISRPDRLIKRFGATGTRALLRKMGEEVRPHGGLYTVCIQNPTAPILTQMREAGFDACTLYCYSSHGMKPGEKSAPYSRILPEIEPLWRRAAQGRELPIIPVVSPGWDSRAWYGDAGLARTDATPELFGRMCLALKQAVDPALGLALVGTWNEFGEGSYIEPTLERGCSMLDALQRAFVPKAAPHMMLAPTAARRAALQHPDIPAHLEEQIARQQGNLVINPGFEREWGWLTFANTPAPGVPWPFRADNLVKLDCGRTYRVSAWVYGRAQVTVALYGVDSQWLGRYQPVTEGGKAGTWTKLEAVITIADPQAAAFDFEIVPVDDAIHVDDVGVWRVAGGAG